MLFCGSIGHCFDSHNHFEPKLRCFARRETALKPSEPKASVFCPRDWASPPKRLPFPFAEFVSGLEIEIHRFAKSWILQKSGVNEV